MSNINDWLNEMEDTQNLPQLPSPGSLFQTKAKFKKLKEQVDRQLIVFTEIKTDGKELVYVTVQCAHGMYLVFRLRFLIISECSISVWYLSEIFLKI